MSNSKLVNHVHYSPNCTKPRNHKIDKITIHHMAGVLNVEQCGGGFADPKRQASANYGIDSAGKVGLYVDEANRSWCSSSRENDHRAVTIEVSNDKAGGDWHISDAALAKLIDLCVDICQRNGIEKLNYTGTKDGNLTMHRMFANTNCPGAYLASKFPYIEQEVNKRLTQKDVCNVELKVLKKGAKGSHVKALQTLLKGYNYDIGKSGVDGSFGSATEKAVCKFQYDNKLTVDGSCGAKTWTKLLGL